MRFAKKRKEERTERLQQGIKPWNFVVLDHTILKLTNVLNLRTI